MKALINEIDENDPLSVLVVPHDVLKWQRKQGMLMRMHCPNLLKKERERGMFAIFHKKLRLRELYKTEEQAKQAVEDIIGNKRKCIENSRIYSVKQLT